MKPQDQLLSSFTNYVKSVNESFDQVREALSRGEYGNAARLMTAISTNQAQMSVNLRSACQVIRGSS